MQGNREGITVTQRLEISSNPRSVLQGMWKPFNLIQQASDASSGRRLAYDDKPPGKLGVPSGLITSSEEFVMDRSRIRENVLIHLISRQTGEGHSMTHPVFTLVKREVTIVF